jgi:hypothetical protein
MLATAAGTDFEKGSTTIVSPRWVYTGRPADVAVVHDSLLT